MKRIALTLVSLFLVGMALAQSGNHWTVISGTQYNMTVKGIIVIDGVVQANNQLEIGAFCGDECRGSRKAALFPPTGEYPVMLTVVSNVFSGETITFRIYDHSTQQELNLTSESTLTFEHNTNQGAMNNWYPFVFTSPTQTFTLPVAGYGSGAGGYRLIAPPFDDIDPAEIEGMTTGDYDLYRFDESQSGEEWRNYEAEPFNLESGKGYLYAHKTDVTLSFTGVPYSGNGQVTLTKTEGVPFAGWNLVGNPFAQTASIDRDCYVMKADGTEIIAGDTRNVDPMQGVFVIAASDGETMAFVPENTTDEGARIVLNVSKGRAGVTDRAIVRFGGNGTLPKMMLDPGNTKLYIPQDGTDYAVVTSDMDNATPVSFKAKENGSYTLSVDIANLDLEYLHLVDNKTGDDIDLLAHKHAPEALIAGKDPQSPVPTYTFEALTTDYAERFQLVYASTSVCEDADGDDAAFAYCADGEIRLFEAADGASLQLVDAKGRVMACRDASNVSAISTTGMAPGVYILRLVNGDDVKVQKIVVR